MDKYKYRIAFLVIAAIAAIHYFFFYKACKDPSEIDIVRSQLTCAQQIDVPTLRAEICMELHQVPECEFTSEDKPFISQKVNDYINKCARKDLTEHGMCADKYKDLQ